MIETGGLSGKHEAYDNWWGNLACSTCGMCNGLGAQPRSQTLQKQQGMGQTGSITSSAGWIWALHAHISRATHNEFGRATCAHFANHMGNVGATKNTQRSDSKATWARAGHDQKECRMDQRAVTN